MNIYNSLRLSLLAAIACGLPFHAPYIMAEDRQSTPAMAQGELTDQSRKMMQSMMDEFQLPALSMAIAIDGKIKFAQAMGYADVANKKTATSKTLFSIGSIAKALTGTALAKLVDAGKIDLDAPVHTYIPKLKPLLWQGQAQTVTVRQVMSHTSGIIHETPERTTAEFTAPRDHKSPLDALYIFENHPLKFKPGSQFLYSSNGYILLSAIIEKVTGKNYMAYLKDSLFTPIGMPHTMLDDSHVPASQETTYYKSGGEGLSLLANMTPRDRSFLFGGGGFVSTPMDLVKFGSTLLQDDFLSASARQIMITPTTLRDGTINKENYAMGWRVGTTTHQGQSIQIIHHGGVMGNAANSFLLIIPNKKAVIAFVTNSVPPKFWRKRQMALKLLLSLTYGE